MLVPRVLRDAAGKIVSITFARPSNFHRHFRWTGMIEAVTPELLRHHKYVLAMPNNGPGEGGLIRSIDDAHCVYERIMDARFEHNIRGVDNVIMTVYLTKDTTPKMVEDIGHSHIVRAVKSYPVHRVGQHGTTNSGHGVPFDECDETIRAMQDNRVRLLIHAEDVNDTQGRELPHAEREAHCVTNRLWKFRDKYPDLQICIEHASTREAIEFVKADTSGNTVMTVTPQHQLFTAKDFDEYSWRNQLRCMPYVKTEEDRVGLLDFTTSGDRRCIAGDDSAPHPKKKKDVAFEEAVCGCWMPHSIALYAIAFMQRDAIDHRFTEFMSLNGPRWWDLPPPEERDVVTIVAETEKDIPDPTPLPEMDDVVIPLGWSENNDRLKVGYATALS